MTCPLYPTPTGTPAAGPLKVLGVGDSVADGIGADLQTQLRSWPGHSSDVVVSRGIGSVDVTPGASGVDLVARTRDLLDHTSGVTHVFVHAYGVQESVLEAQCRAQDLVDSIVARGVKVVWLIPVIVDPSLYTTEEVAAFEAVAAWYQSGLRRVTKKASLRAMLCPGGVYTPCVNFYGSDLTVRADDGTSLHLTNDGYTLARDLVIRNLS